MLTPPDALADCIRALPAFNAYWDAEDTFRDEDGSFSVCGVYLTLVWFLREHWRGLTESEWRAFASMAADHRGRVEDPASNIGACLIEGLEGEEFSLLVARFFDQKLLAEYGFHI